MYCQKGWWYVRYKDSKGKWRSIATGTRDEAEALEFEQNFNPIKKKLSKPTTLEQLLMMFTIPETNPSYLDAQMTGHKYGLRHSQEVARNMRDLVALLRSTNKYWSTNIRKLSRFDCKQIMVMVHGKWGNTDKAHDTFSEFKVCLTYAADQGWIQMSPAADMADIKANRVTEIVPMTIGDIQTIIDHPELFRFNTEPCNNKVRKWRIGVPEMDYAVFVLLALTGMRRSEVAALDASQIVNGIYRGKAFTYIEINRAYKDDKWTVVGLPKWDFARAIPLPKVAHDAIKPYLSEGLVFKGINKSRFKEMFNRLRENAILDGIVWEEPEAVDMLSPHKLRHALNTNLVSLIDPALNTLVEQFMSWDHQEQSKMQRRYTHLVASRLLPVSEEINRWFEPISNECKEKNTLCM